MLNARLHLVQLGVNKPSVIPCAAQLLKVLGVDDLPLRVIFAAKH